MVLIPAVFLEFKTTWAIWIGICFAACPSTVQKGATFLIFFSSDPLLASSGGPECLQYTRFPRSKLRHKAARRKRWLSIEFLAPEYRSHSLNVNVFFFRASSANVALLSKKARKREALHHSNSIFLRILSGSLCLSHIYNFISKKFFQNRATLFGSPLLVADSS
jgi:hypothetical protein